MYSDPAWGFGFVSSPAARSSPAREPAMSLGVGRQSQRVQSGPLSRKQTRPAAGSSSDAAAIKPPTAAGAAASSRGFAEYREVRGDLFACPPSASLAHCVSEDLAMGRGIAKIFKKEFGGVKELKEQGKTKIITIF